VADRAAHSRRHRGARADRPQGDFHLAVVVIGVREDGQKVLLAIKSTRRSPTLRRTWTGLHCGSINARERPWALKPPPIDYARCCIDRLNPPANGALLNRARAQADGALDLLDHYRERQTKAAKDGDIGPYRSTSPRMSIAAIKVARWLNIRNSEPPGVHASSADR
jgi:hypothetical protein